MTRPGNTGPRQYARSRVCALALLRSASGPEVKGSAIRRGIGNYSPERGRASVTFITELSALLGKQCTPFNPAFPSSLHPTPPSIYPFSSSDLNPERSGACFSPRPRSTSSNISSPRSLGERDWVLSDGPQAELRPALFLFIPLYPLPPVRPLNRAFNSAPRRRLSSRNSVTPPLSLSLFRK